MNAPSSAPSVHPHPTAPTPCDWAACRAAAVRYVDGWNHCRTYLSEHRAEFHPAPKPGQPAARPPRVTSADWDRAHQIINDRAASTPTRSTATGSLLSSTAYCETGLMANGHRTYRGAVAGNRWPLGTKLRVSDSPYGPGTFVVADRIGHSSSLDFAIPGDCTAARAWGRRDVRAVVLP